MKDNSIKLRAYNVNGVNYFSIEDIIKDIKKNNPKLTFKEFEEKYLTDNKLKDFINEMRYEWVKNSNNKNKIIKLAIEMIEESKDAMISKLHKLIDSGHIDVDSWDENDAPMILPKCIVSALLDSEINQYSGKDTLFENSNKKIIKNIRYHI